VPSGCPLPFMKLFVILQRFCPDTVEKISSKRHLQKKEGSKTEHSGRTPINSSTIPKLHISSIIIFHFFYSSFLFCQLPAARTLLQACHSSLGSSARDRHNMMIPSPSEDGLALVACS